MLRLSPALLLLSGLCFAAACSAPTSPEVETSGAGLSTSLVISQVYGGGGNSMAPYNRDFVELHNRGSAAVSIAGWAVQYGSTTSAFSTVLHTLTATTIPAGGYYLVAFATVGGTGAALPTPDESDTGTNIAASNGKVALLSTTTPLTGCGTAGNPCVRADIVDFVGFGTASQAEGSAVSGLSNTAAAIRNGGGCAETDNNAADFTAGTPTPRNAHSLGLLCGSGGTDAGTSTTTIDGGAGIDVGTGIDAGTSTASDAGIVGMDVGTSTLSDGGSPDAGALIDAGMIIDGGPYTAVLNEIKVNPPGSDNGFEFIELRGQGTLPSFTYVMSIEGDMGSVQGRVNYYYDLGGVSFGSNGLILIRAPNAYMPPAGATVIDDPRLSGGVIQNGTESIVLITMPSAIDFMPNGPDGGSPTFPFSGASLIDAVGWRTRNDGGLAGTVFGGVDISFQSTPDGVTRFLDDTTALSADSWFGGRLNAGTPDINTWDYSLPRSPHFPSDSIELTPGAPNEGTRAAPELDAGFRDATVRDTGTVDDAGSVDDSGVITPPDAGQIGQDAQGSSDAGTNADAGQTSGDAGQSTRDAGKADSGSGGGGSTASGCGCATTSTSGPASVLLWAAIAGLGVLLRRRR